MYTLLYVLMGLFLTVGLILIGESRRKRPDFPACGNCEYNLSGLPGSTDRCPECGIELGRGTIRLPRAPTTNGLMLAAGFIMVILSLPMCCIGDTLLRTLWGPP